MRADTDRRAAGGNADQDAKPRSLSRVNRGFHFGFPLATTWPIWPQRVKNPFVVLAGILRSLHIGGLRRTQRLQRRDICAGRYRGEIRYTAKRHTWLAQRAIDNGA